MMATCNERRHHRIFGLLGQRSQLLLWQELLHLRFRFFKMITKHSPHLRQNEFHRDGTCIVCGGKVGGPQMLQRARLQVQLNGLTLPPCQSPQHGLWQPTLPPPLRAAPSQGMPTVNGGLSQSFSIINTNLAKPIQPSQEFRNILRADAGAITGFKEGGRPPTFLNVFSTAKLSQRTAKSKYKWYTHIIQMVADVLLLLQVQ